MKRTIILIVSVLVFMTSCATKQEPETTAQVVVDSSIPQAVFASEEIKDAFLDYNIGLVDEAEWVITFEEIDESLGEQAYQINTSTDGRISITGGDTTGLMYGGLEVAEQIRLSGSPEGVKESSGSPNIKKRAIKFHVPLDMRTPSYTDTGDIAQKNIPEMWSIDFWKTEIDEMAKHRYNVLTFWNLNPFPSMVKVPEFPDVALDDVWRTTLGFDDSYRGNATDLVRPEHWENYEVIKQITIDEKIDFWREVMKYADDRGVEFHIYTWNIYTYGENGKYGITFDMDNDTTVEYFRASIREMIKTYPDLDGIGLTVGEQMYWEPEKERANEEWLWNTYGMGIGDALKEEPDRDFRLIHRLHLAEFDLTEDVWSYFPGTLDYSDKYSADHMYSSTNPTFADPTLAKLPEDKRLWFEIKNDDIYYYRWGDPDFARDYIAGMPDESQLRGFMMGSDGYIPGREYAFADTELQGQLFIQKHWFSHLLWGRLGYDPSLSNEFFKEVIKEHFKSLPLKDSLKLADAMFTAGKIIPQVSRLYFQHGEPDWYPEGCLSHPHAFGFLDISRWMKSDNAMQDSGVMSIEDYAKTVLNDTETDLQTPPEVATALKEYANKTLAFVEEVRDNAPSKIKTDEQKEFYGMLSDQEAMAFLGLYYSEKITAAVDLRLYNDTENKDYQMSSVEHLEKALEYWKQYVDVFESLYLPQRLDHKGYFNPADLTKDVEKDIETAENWKPRKL